MGTVYTISTPGTRLSVVILNCLTTSYSKLTIVKRQFKMGLPVTVTLLAKLSH